MESFELTKNRVIMLIFIISVVEIRGVSSFSLEDFFKGMSDGIKKLDQDMQDMNQRLTRLENMVGIHESSHDENDLTVRNGQKSAEISLNLRETKRNLIKAMSVEKQILRESMHNYENRWTDFKTEVMGIFGKMNTTMEQSNEYLTKKIEQNKERVNSIDNNISELDNKHGESIKVLDELNATMKKSNENITKKIEENENLQLQRIESNTQELRTVIQRINTINANIAELDTKHDYEAAKVRNLDSRINKIDDISEATERSLASITNRMNEFHGTRYGFTVNLVSTKQYKKEEAIVFDRVIHNNGESYDRYTGKFTVPKTGTYLFSFSVEGTYSNYAVGQIVYGEDHDFKFGAAANSEKKTYATGSATWVKTLSKGTKVWLQSRGDCEFYKIHTAFTGVLLD